MRAFIIFDIAYAVYFVILSIVLFGWALLDDGDVPFPLFITHLISLYGTIILSIITAIVSIIVHAN